MATSLHLIVEHAKTIANGVETPRKKIEQIKSDVYPKLEEHLQEHGIPIWCIIETQNQLLHKYLKNSLGLDAEAPCGYLYSPKDVGCIGLIAFGDLARILRIAELLKKLLSDNEEIAEEAWKEFLQKNEGPYYDPGGVQYSFRHWMDRSNWRNDYTIEKPERTVPVNYSRGIFKSISLEKESHAKGEAIVLKVQKLGSQNEVVTFEKSSFLTIIESLKKLVHEGIYRRWITDPKGHTGLIESAALFPNVASFYLYPGIVNLSYAEEMFIHQARTRTTLLGGDWFGKRKEVKGEEWCYLCMNGDLDLFHVISNCEERMGDITARHNSVLDLLEEGVLLGTKSSYIKRKDKLVWGSNTSKRPDFVIRKNWSKDEDNDIVIVDVTCPHDVNPERLDICHQDKEDKYTFIQQELKEEYPLAQVHLHSLVVGALGSWRRENFKTFEALGIPKEYHLLLAQLMAKSAIGWS